jgi:ABC-type phosphate/phosphonate transport system substrate-binding protein
VLPAAVLGARRPPVDLFAGAVPTGSHGESLRRLVAAEIDAAPIDSTVLALAAAAHPAVAALPVAELLGPAPIPPVVLLGGTPQLAAALREALCALHEHAAGRAALALGLVERYVPVADADYATVRAMDAAVR